MDDATYQETVRRLKEVNEVIGGLDPSIRSQAFATLEPYVTKRAAKQEQADQDDDDGETATLLEFFEEHGSDKEADNAHAAVAWWYSRYGKSPFSFANVREIAESGEVHIPERLDATVGKARREGKFLYRSAGRGLYRPTSLGENYLKTTFGVSKGRGRPAGSDDDS